MAETTTSPEPPIGLEDPWAPLVPVRSTGESNTSSGSSSDTRPASMYVTAESCDEDDNDDDEEEEEASEEEDSDPETVKKGRIEPTQPALTDEKLIQRQSRHAMAKFREELLNEMKEHVADSVSSDEDPDDPPSTSSDFSEELMKLKGTPDESDPHFEDVFPTGPRNERLDTVEELSEPQSSEFMLDSLPNDEESGKRHASVDTTASFDIQQDSLPPDSFSTLPNGTHSITSKEEEFSVTEIEITLVQVEKSERARKSSQKDRKAGTQETVAPGGFESNFKQTMSENLPGGQMASNSFEDDSLSHGSPRTHEFSVVGGLRPTAEDLTVKNEPSEPLNGEEALDSFSKKPPLMREEAIMQGKSVDSLEEKKEGPTDSNSVSVEDEDESLSVSLPSGCNNEDDDISPESSKRQRIQLAEVRSGIIKLLSEDEEREEHTKLSKQSVGALIKESSSPSSFSLELIPVEGDYDPKDGDDHRTLDGFGSLNTSPGSDDQLRFSEKHEFEDAEKESLIHRSEELVSPSDSSVMPPLEASQAWSNDENPSRNRPRTPGQDPTPTNPIDNDSGIERETGIASRTSGISNLSSSAAAPPFPHPAMPQKMWTNFKKQVKRFGGSTGSLSSPSPNSEEQPTPNQPHSYPSRGHRRSSSEVVYSPEVADMDSPREGGFVTTGPSAINVQSAAMMKQHIGELYAQLTKGESDKQKIADEAYRRVQSIKRDCDMELEDTRLSQLKQADLVDKLKDKVIEYREKNEISNRRLAEVTQVANQAQIRFKDTNEVLITLEERIRATEERRLQDIKQLQVKVEEEEEKNKTLDEVNGVLRSQLESATRANERLALDLTKISQTFNAFKVEQQDKERKAESQTQARFSNDVESVRELRHRVSTFKGQFQDIRMTTEHELASLKNELSRSSRELTTACLNVYTKSGFVEVDGKSISIGSSLELYSQLEKTKLEKTLVERKNANLEESHKKAQKTVKVLESTINNLEGDKNELKREIEDLKIKADNVTDTSQKARTLESHNTRLQNSLFDIAQIVLDDADKEETIMEGLFYSSMLQSTPLARSASKPALRTGSPLRSRIVSDSHHRRTRSASPAMMDSTLTAVQAALNRRQLQVHEYRSKFSQTKMINHQLSKEVKHKSQILESVEDKLDEERASSDSLKIRLDEISREKMTLSERVEMLLIEKSALERTQVNLKDEVEKVFKEKEVITDAYSKTIKDLKLSESEIEHLTQKFREQINDIKDKQSLIGQLESVGSSLRDELIATKSELTKVKAQLKALDQEKSETDNVAANYESQMSSSQTELERFHKEEKRLKTQIKSLEEFHKLVQEHAKDLEDQISKLEEDKIKGKVEAADLKANLETLKEDLVKRDEDSAKRSSELSKFEVKLKSETELREKLEIEIKTVTKSRDELENQMTSVQLRKDSLEDEVSHVRMETSEIKGQLERVNEENATLNKLRSETEVRLEHFIKDLKISEERLHFVRSEKSEQNEIIDDLNFELSQLQKQSKDYESEKIDLESSKDLLTKEYKRVQDALSESNAKLEILKKSHTQDIDDLKDRHEKVVLKLRKSVTDLEEEKQSEKAAIMSKLEKIHHQALVEATKEFEDIKGRLEAEMLELQTQMDRIKDSQEEEMVLLENEKVQSLSLAQQEQTSLKERIDQLTQDLEKSQEDYDKVKRETSSRLEKDRGQISELQLEVSRLRGQLEDVIAKLDGEKSLSEGKIRGEQKAKSDLESQVNTLKITLKYANEKVDNLVEELEETRRKLEESDENKTRSQGEYSSLEKEILELKTKISRMERTKEDLDKAKESIELDKRSMVKKISEKEAIVTELELRDYETRKELDECREQIDLLQENNKSVEIENSGLKSRLRNLTNEYRQLEMENDSIKERSISDEEQRGLSRRESQKLRVRVSELESIRDALERELVSAKSTMTGEEESLRSRISTLSGALEDLRVRERSLEDQRHILELDLTDSRQEIKDLKVKLTGYEGRMTELDSMVLRLDSNKTELEQKLSTVCGILREVRSGQGYGGSSSSPTRRSRRGRSSSPWQTQPTPMGHSGVVGSHPEVYDDLNIDSVRGNVRDLMNKVSMTERERNDALNQVKSVKRQSDDLMVQNVSLEQQLQREREKILGSEEQLRKLEQKISVSDINLANQDEDLLRREKELKEISSKLEQTSQQLQEFKRQGLSHTEGLKRFKEREQVWNDEKRRLQDGLNDAETQIARLETHRKGVGGDQQRLQVLLSEKDQEIQTLRSKVDSLTRGISRLEDKCSNLTSNVDQLNNQLEKSAHNETELQNRVQDLSRTLNYTSSNTTGIQDELEQLRRALQSAENEKKILEDRLDSSRQQNHEFKQSNRSLQNKFEQLENDLQRSESKVNQLDIQLQNSQSYMETNANDNYLKEELARLRRESNGARDKIRELNKVVSHLEKDKMDLERKTQKSPGAIFGQIASESYDQVDHPVIRSQIPLLSSQNRQDRMVKQTQLQVGEYLVKIRILEQENERLQRKIRGLESQLAELEQCHGTRIQEVLGERRKEREKETKRHKDSLRNMEDSLKARERIYKERIKGLEDQVGVLKEQLSKEMRRRQVFISGTSGISSEMNELRQNLDQSLYNVATPTMRLDGTLLDKESQRLSSSITRYGEDHSHRLTPSRISMRGSSSMENIHKRSGSQTTKRILSFDH